MEDKIGETGDSFTFTDIHLPLKYLESFTKFYESDDLCDIQLLCGNGQIKAHKVILAGIFPYFEGMFTVGMLESYQHVVVIKDLPAEAFRALISFAYTSSITISTENVQDILTVASFLQLEVVVDQCGQFMAKHLNIENCFMAKEMAERSGCWDLACKTDEFISAHFGELLDTKEFIAISFETLDKLLDSHNFIIHNHMQLFLGVMTWVRHDLDTRRAQLADLLKNVKLKLLPAAYLERYVAGNEVIKKDLRCMKLVKEAEDYQASLPGILLSIGNKIECYDSHEKHWFEVPNLAMLRSITTGEEWGFSGGTKLYFTNYRHSSIRVYDPVANIQESIPFDSYDNIDNGYGFAYLPGFGLHSVNVGVAGTISWERYDLKLNTWNKLTPMQCPRQCVGITASEGCVYVAGGIDNLEHRLPLNICEKYDPHLNEWTFIAPMNVPRRYPGMAAALNGFLYVVGGHNLVNYELEDCYSSSVERYDPATDQWTHCAPLPFELRQCYTNQIAILGNTLYVPDQRNPECCTQSVLTYDPTENRWQKDSRKNTGSYIVALSVTINQVLDICVEHMKSLALTSRS